MGEENQNDDPGKENTAENDCVEVTDRRVVPPIKIVISKQRRMSVKSKYPKTESIRLSQLLENTLNVSTTSQSFYQLRFFLLPKNLLTVEIPEKFEKVQFKEDVKFSQLLNWPEVEVNLNLSDFSLTRRIKPNYQRELVLGDDFTLDLDKTENVTALRYCSQFISPRSQPEMNVSILLTCLQEILKIIAKTRLSSNRVAELKEMVRSISVEMSSFSEIHVKREYSRFLNRHKYYRVFDNDKDHNEHRRKHPKVSLRETINPEMVFQVNRCRFTNNRLDDIEKDLINYFLALWNQPTALPPFIESVKRCITVECTVCNTKFEGSLCATVAVNEHMEQHYNETPWKCVDCLKSFPQYELTSNGWRHECESTSSST